MHGKTTLSRLLTGAILTTIFTGSALLIGQKAVPADISTPLQSTSAGMEPATGKAEVTTTQLPDGVTGVTGTITIAARPIEIWRIITDYDNHKHFVPKLIDSGLISDNGREQVMFQKGKTGVLLFRKTVYIRMLIKGEPYSRLQFRQIEGDFSVYEGEWLIRKASTGKGSLLIFKAKVKPAFFAPPYFVRHVQKNDLPMILAAMKKRAESSGTTEASGKPQALLLPKIAR